MICVQEDLLHKGFGRAADRLCEEERSTRVSKDVFDHVLENLLRVVHVREVDEMERIEQQERVARDGMDHVLEELLSVTNRWISRDMEEQERERRMYLAMVEHDMVKFRTRADGVMCDIMEEIESAERVKDDVRGYYGWNSIISHKEDEERSHVLSRLELVQWLAVGKVHREEARRVFEHELARAEHHHKFSEVLSGIERRGASKEANYAMEEERMRRVHRERLTDALDEVLRTVNGKHAIMMAMEASRAMLAKTSAATTPSPICSKQRRLDCRKREDMFASMKCWGALPLSLLLTRLHVNNNSCISFALPPHFAEFLSCN